MLQISEKSPSSSDVNTQGKFLLYWSCSSYHTSCVYQRCYHKCIKNYLHSTITCNGLRLLSLMLFDSEKNIIINQSKMQQYSMPQYSVYFILNTGPRRSLKIENEISRPEGSLEQILLSHNEIPWFSSHAVYKKHEGGRSIIVIICTPFLQN